MSSQQPPSSPWRWHQRVHAMLMPDYNRGATVYWWLATTSGGMLLLWCLGRVLAVPASSMLQIAAGLALAVGAGMFPVRIPGTRVSFAAGELCIFTVLLLHGPAAAAVVAAGEAAMASYRTSKRWTSRLGSPAMATLAMYTAGSLLQAGQSMLLQWGVRNPIPLLALAMVIGLLYFLLSATLMGGVARLRRGQHLLQLSDAVGVFRWVGLAYAGSAVVSTLLFIVYSQAGAGVFMVTLPLLAMLLLMLHFYYRQQEAQEAMQRAVAEFAEREAEMRAREAETAAQHVRQLQLSERRFHGAFTHASIGMALVGLDGRVIQANDALGRLVGLQAARLVGTSFTALLHPDDAQSFSVKLATAHGPEFEDFDLVLRVRHAERDDRRLQVNCSFFRGPATHGSTQVGIPCLILQMLDLPPGPDRPVGQHRAA